MIKILIENKQPPQLQNVLHNRKYFPHYPNRTYFEVVKQIPLLRTNKIVSKLGDGLYGKAFQLDNGHVLKTFFVAGCWQDDLRRYIKFGGRTYSKEIGSEQDLPVFDFGKVKVDTDNKPLYFVELARIIPLENWLIRTQRLFHTNMSNLWDFYDECLGQIFSFTPRTHEEVEHLSTEFKEKYEELKEKGAIDEVPNEAYVGFTSNEIIGMADAFDHYIDIVGNVADLHLGNIGLFEHNPNLFILFDN